MLSWKFWIRWKIVGVVSTSFAGDKYTTALFMSDKGHRAYKNYFGNDRPAHLGELYYWMDGGPFPKNFEPFEDDLVPILTKLIDRRLV